MLILYSNGDICIERELHSGEDLLGTRGSRAFRRSPDEVFLVHFREKDQSKFIGRVRRAGGSVGRGIMVTMDGSMYASEYAGGEFRRGYLLGRYRIPRMDEGVFGTSAVVGVDGGDSGEGRRGLGDSGGERHWDMNLELECFRNSKLHEEKVEKLLKDLLRNWGLEDYFGLLQERLSLEDLLLSPKLLSIGGVREALGVNKVGHRIKLTNCIKQFRLVFGPLFLPKQWYTKQQRRGGSSGDLSSVNWVLPLFISRPLNLYSYSGINIPFEQLVFLQRLERTDFPCKCSGRGKFFLLVKSAWQGIINHSVCLVSSSSSCYLGKWLGKDVVIKVFRGKILQTKLWESTCKLIWSLRHPCLVLTLGFCHYFPDIHCVVTEYIHTGSLQKLLYKGSCVCMYSCAWRDSDPRSIKMSFPPYHHHSRESLRRVSGRRSCRRVKVDPKLRCFVPSLDLNPSLDADSKVVTSLNLFLNTISKSQNPPFWPKIPEYNASFGIHSQKTIKIAKGIVTGCLYLKQRGLFHLNLKPSNILVEEDLSVKLTDFGHSLLEASFYPPEQGGREATLGRKAQGNTIQSHSWEFGLPNENLASLESEFSFLNGVPTSPRLTDGRILNYLPPEILRTNSPLLEPAKLYLENKLEQCQSIDSYSIGTIIWEMINGQPPFAGLGNIQIQAYVGHSGATLDLSPAKDSLQLNNVSLIQGLISRCSGFTSSPHSPHLQDLEQRPSKPRAVPLSFSSSCSSYSTLSQKDDNTSTQPNRNSRNNSCNRRICIPQILKELKAIEKMVSWPTRAGGGGPETLSPSPSSSQTHSAPSQITTSTEDSLARFMTGE